jgi:hypothetical protein
MCEGRGGGDLLFHNMNNEFTKQRCGTAVFKKRTSFDRVVLLLYLPQHPRLHMPPSLIVVDSAIFCVFPAHGFNGGLYLLETLDV